jgi:hypothetical protein
MHSILTILLGLTLAAVLTILLIGVAVFVKGGEFNRRWSVKLMSMRVATQALALVILALLLILRVG